MTTTRDSGDPITDSNGLVGGGMMCGRLAVDDGQDGYKMESFQSPSITWLALMGDHGGHEGEEAYRPQTRRQNQLKIVE